MGKKKATFTRHVWSMLRMVLLWARKGGALRRRLMLDLHQAVGHLKRLRDAGRGRLQHEDLYHVGERELSFNETPTFQLGFKVRRPFFFPCINNPADFDVGDDCYDDYADAGKRSCYIVQNDHEEADGGSKWQDQQATSTCSGWEQDDQEGIDVKAEEFIEKFYQQMKLQRQISLLQYNEMLYRGIN